MQSLTEPEFTLDHYETGSVALQVNGGYLVHINDILEDGTAHVVVFAGPEFDAPILFMGKIRVTGATQ